MYDESLAEYNKALTLDPNDARTLFNRGNTYLALERIELAHNDFDKAINLMPSNAKFFHSKGLAYQDTH
jgi:tetratricopeptide (TPR) repeat protein